MLTPKQDRYLLAILIIALVYILYWSAFTAYRYNSYQLLYYDAGVALNSFYVHILYPGQLPGLQYLVYGNHISPFSLILTVILYAFRYPLTIFVLQYASLAATGVVAYFIGRDILGSKLAGFALCVAFLVSAGTRGITVYDYHAEAFIPLFLLIAFYAYMRNNKTLFFPSLALMLCTIDASPAVGVSFAAGLLYFELVYNRRPNGLEKSLKKERVKMLAIALVMSLAFLIAYTIIGNYIISQYSGAYSSAPPIMRLLEFTTYQVAALSNVSSFAVTPAQLVLALLVGVAILFLGFGVGGMVDPLMTLILVAPWAFEILVLRNVGFGNLGLHYYAFTLGGAVVAATLGLKIIQERKYGAKRLFDRWFGKADVSSLSAFTLSCSLVISASLFSVFSGSTYVFLLLATPSPTYANVSSLLSVVPGNASVMSTGGIITHLYYVKDLELPPNSSVTVFTATGLKAANLTLYWEKPEYIAWPNSTYVFNENRNATFNSSAPVSGNYTVVGSVPGLTVYKES